MTVGRVVASFGLAMGVMLVAGPALAAQADPAITITVSTSASDVLLGENVELLITVTNISAELETDLVAHIDITNLEKDGSVDPEDWTATLTKPIGPVASGGTATVDWTVQPISPGRFLVYAVALSADTEIVPASNAVTLDVTDQRTLNPQGILPVAVGMPLGVGLLLADRIRRNRLA